MKVVAGNEEEKDKQSILNIYRAPMIMIIDYGCMVYSAAVWSTLQTTDKLQYKALQIATEATNTTPINALLIESGETPLEIRWVKILLY